MPMALLAMLVHVSARFVCLCCQLAEVLGALTKSTSTHSVQSDA